MLPTSNRKPTIVGELPIVRAYWTQLEAEGRMPDGRLNSTVIGTRGALVSLLEFAAKKHGCLDRIAQREHPDRSQEWFEMPTDDKPAGFSTDSVTGIVIRGTGDCAEQWVFSTSDPDDPNRVFLTRLKKLERFYRWLREDLSIKEAWDPATLEHHKIKREPESIPAVEAWIATLSHGKDRISSFRQELRIFWKFLLASREQRIDLEAERLAWETIAPKEDDAPSNANFPSELQGTATSMILREADESIALYMEKVLRGDGERATRALQSLRQFYSHMNRLGVTKVDQSKLHHPSRALRNRRFYQPDDLAEASSEPQATAVSSETGPESPMVELVPDSVIEVGDLALGSVSSPTHPQIRNVPVPVFPRGDGQYGPFRRAVEKARRSVG